VPGNHGRASLLRLGEKGWKPVPGVLDTQAWRSTHDDNVQSVQTSVKSTIRNTTLRLGVGDGYSPTLKLCEVSMRATGGLARCDGARSDQNSTAAPAVAVAPSAVKP
jgi:hypothetical protein